jgi:hypothetical protein
MGKLTSDERRETKWILAFFGMVLDVERRRNLKRRIEENRIDGVYSRAQVRDGDHLILSV